MPIPRSENLAATKEDGIGVGAVVVAVIVGLLLVRHARRKPPISVELSPLSFPGTSSPSPTEVSISPPPSKPTRAPPPQ